MAYSAQEDMELLYVSLERAGLSQHFENFRDRGMSFSKLSTLTMQDYSQVGVTNMLDRRKLFEMIQSIKRQGVLAKIVQRPGLCRRQTFGGGGGGSR